MILTPNNNEEQEDKSSLGFGFTQDLEFWIEEESPLTKEDEQQSLDRINLPQLYNNFNQSVLNGGGFNQ